MNNDFIIKTLKSHGLSFKIENNQVIESQFGDNISKMSLQSFKNWLGYQ